MCVYYAVASIGAAAAAAAVAAVAPLQNPSQMKSLN